MPDSRVAKLLRDAGVDGPDLSVSAAAARCKVPKSTMHQLWQGRTKLPEPDTLAKIAVGLGIDPTELRDACLADAGYVQTGHGSSVAAALQQIRDLSAHDLATIQIELGRMQQARATGQEMRDAAASAE